MHNYIELIREQRILLEQKVEQNRQNLMSDITRCFLLALREHIYLWQDADIIPTHFQFSIYGQLYGKIRIL